MPKKSPALAALYRRCGGGNAREGALAAEAEGTAAGRRARAAYELGAGAGAVLMGTAVGALVSSVGRRRPCPTARRIPSLAFGLFLHELGPRADPAMAFFSYTVLLVFGLIELVNQSISTADPAMAFFSI